MILGSFFQNNTAASSLPDFSTTKINQALKAGFDSGVIQGAIEDAINHDPDVAALDRAVEDFSEAAAQSAADANTQSEDWLNKVMAFNQASVDKQNQLAQSSANDVMEFNALEAQKQRDWYESLSNTEVQRRVDDIRSAGLNPYLVMNLGAASSAAGSAASTSVPSYGSTHASTPTAVSASVTDKLISGLVQLAQIDSNEAIASKKNITNLLGSFIGLLK